MRFFYNGIIGNLFLFKKNYICLIKSLNDHEKLPYIGSLHQRPGYSSQSVDTIFPGYFLLRHFVDDELLKVVQLSVPLVQGRVPRCVLVVFVQLQHPSHLRQSCYVINRTRTYNALTHLVDPPVNSAVQDAAHQQTLHIRGVDVQLARDELYVNASVGLDELYENLTIKTNYCISTVRHYSQLYALPVSGCFSEGPQCVLV